MIGLHTQHLSESRGGLAVAAGHVLGNAQIQPQPRIAGQRLNQLLVERNRVGVPALGEQTLGLPRLERELILRLARGGKREKNGDADCQEADSKVDGGASFCLTGGLANDTISKIFRPRRWIP